MLAHSVDEESVRDGQPAYDSDTLKGLTAYDSPNNVFSSNLFAAQHDDANSDNEQKAAYCALNKYLSNVETSGIAASKPRKLSFKSSEDFVFNNIPLDDDMDFTHADYLDFLTLYDKAFPLEQVSLLCMHSNTTDSRCSSPPATPKKKRACVCATPTVMDGDRCVKWCTYPVGHEGAHEGQEEQPVKRISRPPKHRCLG